MTLLKPQSAGGIAWGKIQREKALLDYFKNPKLCQYCGQVIQPCKKICHTKKKVFCNRKCSSEFRVKNKGTKEKSCIKPSVLKRSMHDNLKSVTKQELFDKRKNWQSARTAIRKYAFFLFPKEKLESCAVCSYSKYVEICHIKSVSSFPPESMLGEINDPSNLIGLCPNCHWEFDNGLLNLEEVGCRASELNGNLDVMSVLSYP